MSDFEESFGGVSSLRLLHIPRVAPSSEKAETSLQKLASESLFGQQWAGVPGKHWMNPTVPMKRCWSCRGMLNWLRTVHADTFA